MRSTDLTASAVHELNPYLDLMNADDTELVVAHTSADAEALQKKIRRARIVAAFGTVPSEVLFVVFEARR